MMYAAANGRTATAKALLEAGAKELGAADPGDQSTALHLASINGHAAVARLLLTCGADAHVYNKHDETSLALACEHKRMAVIDAIFELEADTKQLLEGLGDAKGSYAAAVEDVLDKHEKVVKDQEFLAKAEAMRSEYLS